MLVHLAASYSEYAEGTSDNSEISANRLIDYQTRCTYNLLHAASEAGVSRCIYASSLVSLHAAMTIGPSTSSGGPVLPPSRRFWRSTWESSSAASLRGKGASPSPACAWVNLGRPNDKAEQPSDPMWLSHDDAVHAFECALAAPAQPWAVYHIQSAFPRGAFQQRQGAGCDRLCSASGQLGE